VSQTLRKLKRGYGYDGDLYPWINPFQSCPNASRNFCNLVTAEQLDPQSPVSEAFGQVCISNTWRTVSEVYVVVGGAWRTVTEVDIAIGGTWRGLSV
jgi:hypothetical protein